MTAASADPETKASPAADASTSREGERFDFESFSFEIPLFETNNRWRVNGFFARKPGDLVVILRECQKRPKSENQDQTAG